MPAGAGLYLRFLTETGAPFGRLIRRARHAIAPTFGGSEKRLVGAAATTHSLTLRVLEVVKRAREVGHWPRTVSPVPHIYAGEREGLVAEKVVVRVRAGSPGFNPTRSNALPRA